jgi:putative peptidoglycan lipid II flippase
MAVGTGLSRLSGFARVVAIGWVLGQHALSDAYNQANTIPNTIYDLLLGGVLSATLLPVLMQSLNRPRDAEDEDAVPAVVSFLTVALVVATVLFWLLAPYIVDFFLALANGTRGSQERALATTWLRLFTPQLLFIGLTTVANALLNARRRFMAASFSPVLANVVTIAALVLADRMVKAHSLQAYSQDRAAVVVLGVGTTAGYLVQLLAQVPSLVKARVPVRPVWKPHHPALVAIGRLSGWTVGAVLANQASLALVSVLANRHSGSYSSFTYAYYFMLLPYSVIAVSIAFAVAPELAERWSLGDRDGFALRATRALRQTVALVVPAGVGLAVIGQPVMVLAMAHGNLPTSAARSTGVLLSIFALGLPGLSSYLLLMRAFQSQQDTRSMFGLYLVENAMTVVAALVLYPPLGVVGLTIAWIAPYSLCLPLVWQRLRRSADLVVPPLWWRKVGVATVSMALVEVVMDHFVPAPASFLGGVVKLAVVVAAAGPTYLLMARRLNLTELDRLLPGRFPRRAGAR